MQHYIRPFRPTAATVEPPSRFLPAAAWMLLASAATWFMGAPPGPTRRVNGIG